MKSGLVLLDTKEPKFHVESFMKGNRAQRLEDMWPQFRQSMTVAAQLLHSFGLSGSSVPAENIVIPIAYYAHHRRLKPSFAAAHAHEKDRARVRAFVARTLLQRRYWTGVVDPVLVAARDAIKSNGSKTFPLDTIEDKLSTIKTIEVTDELLDELATLRYGDRRTFTLLRLLFPHMVHHGPSSGGLDKDHVFPLGKFIASQLRQAGIDADQLDQLRGLADLLPNLQLLRADDNQGGGKSAKLPKEWLGSLSAASKRRYTLQDVKHLPADLAGFENFYNKRQEQLRKRIKKLLVPT